MEAIIAVTLREQWLVEEAPPLAPVVEEIRARCSTAGERPPSYIAVQGKIPQLFDAITIAKARSANPKHVRRLKPRPGYITVPHPLAVCQIDHTPTDIHFVEVVNDAGMFVGRPYLTIVVDVFSRAILGFCLTIEKPSSLSVALCLAQALCPKDAWLSGPCVMPTPSSQSESAVMRRRSRKLRRLPFAKRASVPPPFDENRGLRFCPVAHRFDRFPAVSVAGYGGR